MPATSERINCKTLVNNSNGSNKQYTIWLERRGDGFVVRANWGPVDGWVQEGDKTKVPVTEAKALAIFDSTVAEKRAKGYAFSDGTLLEAKYGKNDRGIWEVKLVRKGTLFDSIEQCDDKDAKIYSDVAKFKDGLTWAYTATEWARVK